MFTQSFNKHFFPSICHCYQVSGVEERKSTNKYNLALRKIMAQWGVKCKNDCEITSQRGCTITENKYELNPGALRSFSVKKKKTHNWPFIHFADPPTLCLFQIRSDQISRSVVSYSLRPHESQHARPPCPSLTPGVHSDSCPSSQWCHPAISSSVIPFSSCPQSLRASESFPMSQLFEWGGQSTGVSAVASFLPKKSQGWSPSEWTGWIFEWKSL